MKYFSLYLLAFLNTTVVAQKMNIGASQADFRFSISGIKLINGKYVSVGLSTRPDALDSLITSLKKEYTSESRKKNASDSMKLVLLERLSYCYSSHPMLEKRKYSDSIIYYENQKLVLARKIKEADMAARSYGSIWYRYRMDNLPISVRINLLKEWVNDYNVWIKEIGISFSSQSPHLLLANIYEGNNDDETAESTALKMLEAAKTPTDKWFANNWLGNFYYRYQKKAKALHHLNEVLTNHPPITVDEDGNILAWAAYRIAKMKIESNEFDKALSLVPYIDIAKNCNNCRGSNSSRTLENDEYRRNILTAEVYLAQKEPAKALPYLQKLPILINGSRVNEKIHEPNFDRLWHQYYLQTQDNAKALAFLQKYMAANDSVQKVNKEQDVARSKSGISLARSYETLLLQEKADREKMLQDQRLLTIEKQNELEKTKAEADKRGLISRAENAELQRKIETARIQDEARKKKQQQDFQISSLNKDITIQQRTRTLLIAGLSLFVLFAGLLFAQNRQKQKANALLQRQRDEIQKQRTQLQQSLENLKTTQNQLIQKEKLASLGELTAGIAHEIQNPLNFVNNFSEMSVELAKELDEEIDKEVIDKGLVKELVSDLSQNQQKINHHGKRASSIVSGMLEHSRTSTGERVMTDINKLADEYLRLSYHGMRAKYKNFNADYELIADESLPLINVVPQDMGRVLLNLINNAFYAVNVGENLPSGVKPTVELLADVKNAPKVIVKTAHSNNQLIIKVIDNGPGIPADVLPKIFQPFFTTKPTGEGTGLGLSLAYDIVTKGHGGTLEVNSTEEVGTEFVVKLPIQTTV